MTGRCFLTRRRFVPYVEGELPAREQQRVEQHLARCGSCRALLARVRAGREAGRQFGRLGTENGKRLPEFDELWAGRRVETILRPMAWTRAAPALVVLVLAVAAALVMSQRAAQWKPGGQTVLAAAAGRSRDFVPLRIADFPSKSAAPVVTEGFVHGVYFDKEEKTLHIKLVEQEQNGEPFVICEVRSPGRMTIPQEGSRVRVYGTPRFDAQPGRGWNEVNPVTNIDILKR